MDLSRIFTSVGTTRGQESINFIVVPVVDFGLVHVTFF